MSFFQFLKSKSFFKQIAFSVIGLLVIVFVIQWWLGITTNHDQKIEVPNLQKLTIAEVEQKLSELNLQFKVIDSASFNPEYPKLSVIEQAPEAGEFVKEKRKIYLTLNPSKYRDVTLPDINGKSRRQVETQLTSLGFNIGQLTYVPDIGKDVVRGFSHRGRELNAGEKLPKHSVIDLVLGDGMGNSNDNLELEETNKRSDEF